MQPVAAGNVYVGPAGWSYEDWKGRVYPPSPGGGFDPLVYLSRFFDLIEINSTFYRPPARKTVESWVHRVRDRERFRFTVKVFKGLTHENAGAAEAASFVQALRPLSESGRLGSLLLQFPFWFEDGTEGRDRLSRLAERLRGAAPLSVEVRHASWIAREPMTFLADLGLGFVNIDMPRGRTTPPPTAFATTTTGYVRLHGRNSAAWFSKSAERDQKYDYHYSGGELDEWVRRVRTLNGKTSVTYVVTNNHFRGQAPANALEIMARIADRRIPVPAPLADAYPELREIGEVEERPGDLF